MESAGISNVLSADKHPFYAVDGVLPNAVVLPSTVKELSEVVSLASDRGGAVTPYGGGTMMSLGNQPRGSGLVVVTTSLDGILQYEPSDLTITVQAGITLAKLAGVLAKEGQFLPLEVPFPGRATVGGLLAAAYSGPLSLFYGLPRDWLIGIRVVNANGTVTKAGGKVVKNVTGYDMNKLYTGSLGTLGIIAEATFKVAPKPPVSRTLAVSFSDTGRGFGRGVDAVAGIWQTLRPNCYQRRGCTQVDSRERGLSPAGFILGQGWRRIGVD